MINRTPELKRVATEVLAEKASGVLMNRIFLTVEQTPDPHAAALKVEKLVALFLGTDQAVALRQSFAKVLA